MSALYPGPKADQSVVLLLVLALHMALELAHIHLSKGKETGIKRNQLNLTPRQKMEDPPQLHIKITRKRKRQRTPCYI